MLQGGWIREYLKQLAHHRYSNEEQLKCQEYLGTWEDVGREVQITQFYPYEQIYYFCQKNINLRLYDIILRLYAYFFFFKLTHYYTQICVGETVCKRLSSLSSGAKYHGLKIPAQKLCNPEQVDEFLCASISALIKWR